MAELSTEPLSVGAGSGEEAQGASWMQGTYQAEGPVGTKAWRLHRAHALCAGITSCVCGLHKDGGYGGKTTHEEPCLQELRGNRHCLLEGLGLPTSAWNSTLL